MVGLEHYLTLAAALFSLGVVALRRRVEKKKRTEGRHGRT